MEKPDQSDWVDGESSIRTSLNSDTSPQPPQSTTTKENLMEYSSTLTQMSTNIDVPMATSMIDSSFVECQTTTTTNQQFDQCEQMPIIPVERKEIDCVNYELNKDSTPDVIVKHPDRPIEYNQDIGIRYLKPPTPPPSGDIIIREVRPAPIPEAPPIYIRLRPNRPKTPPPLIIREAPPPPPKRLSTVVIDKVLPPAPPPPRQVIVEKLPPLPPKPQQVIIEKWLPYEKMRRNIIYQKLPDLPPQKKIKNKLITWSPIKAMIRKRYHNLGVIKADPSTYTHQFNHQLTDSSGTINAIRELGAQIHFSEATRSHDDENIYVEDKAELDRLMNTNFHPSDPICKQFVEKHGQMAYSQATSCDRSEEASRIANQYAYMHDNNLYSQAGGSEWTCSAYGDYPPSALNCNNDVFAMYPDFCQGSQFVPMMNGCPYTMEPAHSIETCQICRQMQPIYPGMH